MYKTIKIQILIHLWNRDNDTEFNIRWKVKEHTITMWSKQKRYRNQFICGIMRMTSNYGLFIRQIQSRLIIIHYSNGESYCIKDFQLIPVSTDTDFYRINHQMIIWINQLPRSNIQDLQMLQFNWLSNKTCYLFLIMTIQICLNLFIKSL